MAREQLADFLRQAYAVEQEGAEIYEAALRGLEDEELRDEWDRHLEWTRERAGIVRELLEDLDLDPAVETPARLAVRQLSETFAGAMNSARACGVPGGVQLVAAAYVVFAETKGDECWEGIRSLAGTLRGDEARSVRAAHERVAKRDEQQLDYLAGLRRDL